MKKKNNTLASFVADDNAREINPNTPVILTTLYKMPHK